jgi:LPXTG-site transpeptidase (sortase) family protein
MKKNTIVKLIAAVIVFAGAMGAGYYFLWAPHFNQNKPAVSLADQLFGWKFPTAVVKFPSTGSAAGGDLAYSDIRDPGGVPQGLPVRLQIPIIGVDSAIEDALITPDGRMDVPSGTVDVAWFALGPHPGQVGSAVIGGHYGIQDGIPFVFYDLNKLKVGDNVYIIDDEGNTLTFIVRSIASFNRNADATSVFTSSDGLAHLNIITCEGIWNQINGNYPLRLVVFTDLVPPVGTVIASTTFSRPLGIGTQGMDVAALQTVLVQKGFLVLPTGVAKGVFGVLTHAAVAKYQASEGLPSVGVFGPLTTAKLVAELARSPILPSTGIESATTTLLQTLVQSVQSLYATPIDGIATSLLLVLIAFMIVAIFRRSRRK